MPNPKIIIGVHDGHNSSAALLEDGKLTFAVQEERITRNKNQGDLPKNSLKSIVERVPQSPRATFELAYGWKSILKHYWRREDILTHYSRSLPRLPTLVRALLGKSRFVSDWMDQVSAKQVENQLQALLGSSQFKLHRIDHHLCHASAAYYGWGKMSEKVLVLTCDGAGDDLCASVNIGEKGSLTRIAQVDKTHSVGRLYANISYLLGLVPLEHEYKVMGLAPYAAQAPESLSIAKQFESCFTFEKQNGMVWKRNGIPPVQYSLQTLEKLLSRERFDHVAAGTQIFLERFLSSWVRNCIRETGISKVAFSGGVFMNVRANQKLLELPELSELFVFPSCGDESNAMGSAWNLYRQLNGNNPQGLTDLYLGDRFEASEIQDALSNYSFQQKIKIKQVDSIEKNVAELLARGEIVARFKGRMEFGARALGNRSILADPSNPEAVRIINSMIKNRDFWMPFAPSVKADESHRYFEKPKTCETPYMMITLNTKKEKREKLIAALHPHDFTARPQEVYESWNSEYYHLLSHFESITGESAVLNTSYNLHGEPIVHTPADALRVFDLSGLKYLALDSFLLNKEL